MTFLLVLTMVVAITLGLALLVSIVETGSGYIGDSSLVPSVLVLGLVILIIIVVIGFIAGNIGVWVK